METIKVSSRKINTLLVIIISNIRFVYWNILTKGLGKNSRFHGRVTMISPETITIGRRVTLNEGVGLYSRKDATITIEDDVRVSPNSSILVGGLNFEGKSPPYQHKSGSIKICKGVWIGSHSLILPGVTIGRFSIIAAGSVVNKNVPEKVMVAGVPARIIKYY